MEAGLLQSYLSPQAYRSLQVERLKYKTAQGKHLEFYGNNRVFIELTSFERMLSGPAETGKTLACLWLLNKLAWEHPGLQAAIVRKTYKSMPGTVLETFEKKILSYPPMSRHSPVKAFGGKRPERYIYPNGSTIWLGGMDNPDRILSAERDVIYVNQSEELALEEWETLLTRATGRAGHIDRPFVMGDCNPAWGTHWILNRSSGGTLERIDSRHEDNPVLFNQETGELTEQGQRTLGVLDTLSGVRYKRLRLGQWITEMEGALWTRDLIEAHRVYSHPSLHRILVCIDPAATTGQTGIVVLGAGKVKGEPHIFVIQDATTRVGAKPSEWGKAAVSAYHKFAADRIIGEVNHGGDMVENVIRSVPDGKSIAYKAVRASRGKEVRAEPAQALYEKGYVHHVGEHPELEDEMCTWVPGESDWSPNRLDAMVWGVTELGIKPERTMKSSQWGFFDVQSDTGTEDEPFRNEEEIKAEMKKLQEILKEVQHG